MPGSAVRAHVLYRGDVQGVGFRWRVVRAAEGRPVAGWVRNLADGRVELVAEGRRADVVSFLDAVARSLAEHIEDADVVWDEPPSGLAGFTVRR